MNKLFRRKSPRYQIKPNSNNKVSFTYMGQPMTGKIKDMSTGGIGFIIEKEPFSIIDNEILQLRIICNSDQITIPVKVMYSFKVGFSRRVRRYGAQFLNDRKTYDIKKFIFNYCTDFLRETR